MNFHVFFNNNVELVYELIDHEIVTSWSNLIVQKTISDCCPHNHYIGYASDTYIDLRIARLYELADRINYHVPNRVIKTEFTKESWKEALQIMHVHFPDLKNDENYKHIWTDLSEYNDIIHWLESTLLQQNTDGKYFRITLDFNKNENTSFHSIPDNAYHLFDPYVNFGSLLLHYTHVGKNAHELLTHRDLICPKDQFVPQRTYSASVRLYFTNNFHITDTEKNVYDLRWQQFYNRRGKEFWGLDINDPKIALGYLKIGQLVSHNTVDISEIQSLRNKLVNSKISHWTINGA